MTWHPALDLPSRRPGDPADLAYPEGCDNFSVEEIPLYEACGEGEHLYLEIEKRNLGTPELLARIAAALDIPQGQLGWAGLKDASARARQRISVPRAAAEPKIDRLGDEDYRVLARQAHRNKLRIGHLAGNRFRLRLLGSLDRETFAADLVRLRQEGLPNYFGFQRFGAQLDNHRRGRELLERRANLRGRRTLFLASAFQSALFNRVLAERLESLGRLQVGDLAWIHGKGAIFQVEDSAREQARASALEISPTGPLPGQRMIRPAGLVGDLEARLLEEDGWRDRYAKSLRGGRRPLRVPVGELDWRELPAGPDGPNTVELSFTLPPGSYASMLLAELGVHAPLLSRRRAEREEG